MKAHGNGRPEQCAANLLMITRGEVPFERIKGRDAELIDSPNSAMGKADIEWLLTTYEPRININEVDIYSLNASEGQFAIKANISTK